MDTYVEQYQPSRRRHPPHLDGRRGAKRRTYITGVSSTPVAPWFRAVLRAKHLADITVFPQALLIFMPKGLPRRR